MINFKYFLEQLPAYTKIRAQLEADKHSKIVVTGLSQVHKVVLANTLINEAGRAAVIITADEVSAVKMCEDLNSLSGERVALHYPAKELIFRDLDGASREYEHERLRILEKLGEKTAKIVVASIEAALQHTMPPEELKSKTKVIKSGETLKVEELLHLLEAAGYEHRTQVEGVCQYAHRGGIVDFAPPGQSLPYRVEFWGDEIDQIARFEIDTQRRTENCDDAVITPAKETIYKSRSWFAARLRELMDDQKGKHAPAIKAEIEKDIERLESTLEPRNTDKYINIIYPEPATLLSYTGESLLFLSDPIAAKQADINTRGLIMEDIKTLMLEGGLFKGCGTYTNDFDALLSHMEKQGGIVLDTFLRQFGKLPLDLLENIEASQLASWSGDFNFLAEDLESYTKSGYTTVVVLGNERGAKVLVSDLLDKNFDARYCEEVAAAAPGKVLVTVGGISDGFEIPALKLAVIHHGKAQSLPKSRRSKGKKKNADPIQSLSDLTVGNYVVHTTHGIGVYEGIIKKELHGIVKDYIKIRYAGTDMLYVPITQMDLISKYIGAGDEGRVKLNKLNSADWQKTKQRVKKAVAEMAEELILLYAKRAAARGFQFSEDNEWQREFEQRFEFEETDDQLRCVEEIKGDMQKVTPMDRLLCGDVGFGKTEVAIRAAFKCVMDSKQCAVLVPTTILAWQHYQTFTKRMEHYPIRIELLSRFKTPKEQKEIIADIKKGLVDIVIGTHRVIQKDIIFKDLGLAIIDEEQRFGVAHKEKFKEQFTAVDMLTLSATPIPRTLNMAMSGIRDMSLIEEAPMDRHPVQTYVMEHSWEVIRTAIERELRRGGQVFYLHNRVDNIESCARKLQELVPDIRVVTAHGRMGEEELSRVWQKLMEHEIDVLVCTTIIETGVDVSNCNTLIIENADRMGLSQLYQLRGRVGRSTRRAFAYFTFTRDKELTEIATKRLTAIKEFTSFGSGFRIAIRDLEIRGAGNILSGQQHGHMEAVGYDMYLKLLSEAVTEQRGEKPQRQATECTMDLNISAHIPERYIEDPAARIDIYKKIAAVRSAEECSDVIDELIDRFGEPPKAVVGLLDVALVRGKASVLGIKEISQKGGDNVFFYPEQLDMPLVAALAAKFKGRVMLTAGVKPYMAIKIPKGRNALDTIDETLDAMLAIVEKDNA